MRTIVFAACALGMTGLGLPAGARAEAASATPIAVLEFQAAGVPSDTTRAMSARLREYLVKMPGYTVIDKGNMDTVLSEQKLALKMCIDDTSCLLKVGKQLAVREMVTGKVSNTAQGAIVTIEHTDTESARVLNSSTSVCQCGLAELLAHVDRVAEEFFPFKLPTPAANMAAISVRTTPSNATLMINGRFYDHTDAVANNLKPGKYRLDIRLDGYRTVSRMVELRSGEVADLRFKLEPEMHEIELIPAENKPRLLVFDVVVSNNLPQLVTARQGLSSVLMTTLSNASAVSVIDQSTRDLIFKSKGLNMDECDRQECRFTAARAVQAAQLVLEAAVVPYGPRTCLLTVKMQDVGTGAPVAMRTAENIGCDAALVGQALKDLAPKAIGDFTESKIESLGQAAKMGNESVFTDQQNKLVWQLADGGEMSWDRADDYCDGLNLGGLKGWRLPTTEELSMLQGAVSSNAAFGKRFSNTSRTYWSSQRPFMTRLVGGLGSREAEVVNFKNGRAYTHYIEIQGRTYLNFTRCVTSLPE